MNYHKSWQKHLSDNNMTYREHLVFAVSHGLLCIKAGTMLIIHGILPCFFQVSGSNLVKKLNRSFNQHKIIKSSNEK